MIRMSKLADYGLVLMTQFLRYSEGGTNLSARQMALETDLPLPMVSKVLKVLTRAGLLVSHRGANGGYGLSRHPKKISVGEILGALEGPVAMTECLEQEGDCRQQQFCPVRTNWERINFAVTNVLDAITLADMVDPLPDQLVTISGSQIPTYELRDKETAAAQCRA